jgi:hypothetical protein
MAYELLTDGFSAFSYHLGCIEAGQPPRPLHMDIRFPDLARLRSVPNIAWSCGWRCVVLHRFAQTASISWMTDSGTARRFIIRIGNDVQYASASATVSHS